MVFGVWCFVSLFLCFPVSRFSNVCMFISAANALASYLKRGLKFRQLAKLPEINRNRKINGAELVEIFDL